MRNMRKKTCTKCKKNLPATAEYFYRHKGRKDGLSSRCKGCERRRRQQNREGNRQCQRKYARRNREEIQNRHYQKKYGLSSIQYNLMAMEQYGLCAICDQPETIKDQSGRILPLAVDHDHIANKVRGLLCGNCNRAIGIMKDNSGLLRLAAAYLEKHCPKIIRVYCSHYVRGPKGLKATEKDMQLNCRRATVHGLELETKFPNVDFYVPGAVDEPIAVAYKRGYLTEERILKIDCEIIDTCRAVILLVWGDILSRGMQIEVDYAKAHDVPIFRTDKPEDFEKFVEVICRKTLTN